MFTSIDTIPALEQRYPDGEFNCDAISHKLRDRRIRIAPATSDLSALEKRLAYELFRYEDSCRFGVTAQRLDLHSDEVRSDVRHLCARSLNSKFQRRDYNSIACNLHRIAYLHDQP